ncbi:hypothetical protein QUB61_10270 [Microcoleus sp. C2D2]
MLVGNGMLREEGRRKKEEGRRNREEGRGKKFLPTSLVCCCCQKSLVQSSHIAKSNN